MLIKGATASSYDEVFDAGGALRPGYAELQRRLGFDVMRPALATAQRLRDRPLGDDARILPIPWVLDGTEYSSVIAAGTAQRARALQTFFADLVLGSQRFLGDDTSLTAERLDLILESEGTSLTRLRSLWEGHTRNDVRFVYGPDLVRGPDGRWLVIEDNVGCIGGSADSDFVWNAYLDATGMPTSSFPRSEPDLAVAIRMWMRRIGRTVGDDACAAVLGCEAGGDDLRSVLILENARRQAVLDALGIGVIGSCQRADDRPVQAIVNFHTLSPRIDDAFRQQIALFNAPGTGILGNKALLPYVDEMIRLYCGEEPIIETPPTHLLDNGQFPAQPDDWVVKSSAGCQGTEVFELRRQPPARVGAIRSLVRESWPKVTFVAQSHVEPSHLSTSGPGAWDRYLVELRPVTYVVGWSDAFVSRVPLGKAVSTFDVRRQHNVSQGACYVPVTSVPSPSR